MCVQTAKSEILTAGGVPLTCGSAIRSPETTQWGETRLVCGGGMGQVRS